MKRPARIMVFGILCLVAGALSGLNNFSELVTAMVGPSVLTPPEGGGFGGEVGEMMAETTQALQAALGNPSYRIALGVDSLVGCVMAGLLVVAGVALLRDVLWSVKLARVWAWYGLFASVLTVVMQARFVMPEMSSAAAPQGAAMMGVACMLPFLWALPVCILTLLGRPIVMNYLNWRAGQGRAVSAPIVPPQSSAAAPSSPSASTHTPSSAPTNVPSPRPTTTRPADHTWRDDPWNDTHSR